MSRAFPILVLLLASCSPPAAQDEPGSGPDDHGVSFAVITDLHLPDATIDLDQYAEYPDLIPLLEGAEQNLRTAVDELLAVEPAPDLVLVLGDLVHDFDTDRDLADYRAGSNHIDEIAAELRRLPMPWYAVAGNHDHHWPEAEQLHTLYREKLGANHVGERPYQAVTSGNVRFLLLDPYLKNAEAPYEDPGFGEEQLTWIGQELDEDLPTFIALHPPLDQVAAEPHGGQDSSVLWEGRDNVLGIVSGHLHQWSTGTHASTGAPQIVCHAVLDDASARLTVDVHDDGGGFIIVGEDEIDWFPLR